MDTEAMAFGKAALMSGLIFGLMHLNFNQFSYGFVLGVIFAAVVEASGSIYASMAIHFLINFQSATGNKCTDIAYCIRCGRGRNA